VNRLVSGRTLQQEMIPPHSDIDETITPWKRTLQFVDLVRISSAGMFSSGNNRTAFPDQVAYGSIAPFSAPSPKHMR
jgi:hypothetical protein